MIAPLCGNGMSMALHGSKIAADAIQVYLEGGIAFENWKPCINASGKNNFHAPGGGPVAAAFFRQRTYQQFVCANVSHAAVPGFVYHPQNARPAVLRHSLCSIQPMAESKKTLVLGASPNPSRYSYMAVNRLAAHRHPVVAIGKRKGTVGGVEINRSPGG
jgi:hypothetical protein